MDDSDVSFSSHVDLTDLEKTQTKSLNGNEQKEVVAGLHWRHRKLASIISNWRLQIESRKQTELHEMKLLNLLARSCLKARFERWRKRARINERLHCLGEKLRAGRYFSLWNRTLERGLDRRKTFLRFLLIRRSIYQRQFMRVWRAVHNLKLKLGAAARQADAKLGHQVMRVFALLVQKRREEQALSGDVARARTFYTTKASFHKWHIRLFHQRLANVVNQRSHYRRLNNSFVFWRRALLVRDVRRERRDAVKLIADKFAMRLVFNHWYRRFYKQASLASSEAELVRVFRRRGLGRFFTRWVSKFRTQDYLHGCHDAITGQRALFVLKKSFGKWHDMYTSLSKKYEMAAGSAARYNKQRLRMCLHRWSRRCRQARYHRRMTHKAKRKLRAFHVCRLFGRWEHAFQVHRDERLKTAKADRFRTLSLQVKAFYSWKTWRRASAAKKSAEALAEEHYVLRLQHHALRCWKILHVKSIRQYVMVTSVLQTWAQRVKLKCFTGWRRYNEQKQLMRYYAQTAFQLYQERRMTITLAAFIAAAQEIPFAPETDEQQPVIVSTLAHSTPTIPEPKAVPLARPKCPAFLAVKRSK